MHEQAKKFTIFVKNILTDFFKNKIVLDVGSGDINGNNKFLFDNCIYHGNDVAPAPNVTIVNYTKDLPFSDNYFDTIISTECFEHDPEYKQSMQKIYKMLKPGGLFLFTCASTGRQEHGTRRTTKNDSYGTIFNIGKMQDYYKNLTELDLYDALDIKNLFYIWDTYYNNITHDLYFVGIKKNNSEYYTINSLSEYKDHGIVKTTQKI